MFGHRTLHGMVALTVAGALVAGWVFAAPALGVKASGEPQRESRSFGKSAASAAPVVVELFTSEGCSSCPSADDLLRSIANTTSENGQPIVALSEHVTYWNRLGWADPFSSDTFSSRQDRYGTTLGNAEVYTPQAIVNGREQFVGSDAAALSHALRAELKQTGVALAITEIHRSGNSAVLRVRNGALPDDRSDVELWAAVTDDADQSRVLRGENGGRTLHHAAVVRSLVQVGRLDGAGEQTVTVPLPASVAGAADQGHRVALLAQLQGQGAIVGAAQAAL